MFRAATLSLVIFLFQAVSLEAQTNSLQEVAKGLESSLSTTSIYIAKEFITVDPKKPRVEAVAVRDGRFIAVGSLSQVQAIVGKDVAVVNTFSDKVAIAGFVEQHVHPVLAAITMATKVISIEDWDAIDGFSPAVRDPVGYQNRLSVSLEQHRKGTDKAKPFISWGYHHYMHGEISRRLLSEMAPDFPVIIWHRSCHEFFFNDAALKLAGIDQAFFDSMSKGAKEQANFERGHFFEQGALAILGKIAPILASKEQFLKGLQFTEEYYHRNGITVCCEPGGFASKSVQDLINSVYSDDATPFNHYFMADGKSLAAANPSDPSALIAESKKVLDWGSGRTRYFPKQVKLLTDGAIFSQLMMMKDGYTDGHQGAWIMDPPLFGFAFQSYWDAGYQIHVHNNGDAGLDVLIGELEKAMVRNPRKDHRTVLVHFGFAREEQVEKWIKLGGVVSSNPYYVTALAGPYATLGLTPELSENMVPHGFVLKQNGSLSFHSDMPMAPAKPLQLMWAGVNRLTYEGKVAGPKHKVPVDVAVRAITIDAAYSIQLEKEVGSIEVGKRANLTILDQSPFDVSEEMLKEIAVWGTMLEGRVQPVSQSSKSSVSSREPFKRVEESQSKSLASEDPRLHELQVIRQKNAEYWRMVANQEQGDAKFSRIPTINRTVDSKCGPSCSCSLNGVLGSLIAKDQNFHWNSE